MCNYWPTKYFRCCEKKWGLKKGEEKHLYLDQCEESFESGRECVNIPISKHSVFWIFKQKCEACKEEEAKESMLLKQISKMQFREKDENKQKGVSSSNLAKDGDKEMKDSEEKIFDLIHNPLEEETV
jgi:hypothetical protein